MVGVARADIGKGDSGLSLSEPGSRARPDGTVLQWETAQITGAGTSDVSPFFIHWATGTQHPAVTSPTGCQLQRLSIGGPKTEALAKLLHTLGVDVPVRTMPEPTIELTLRCPKGSVVMRP